jgi:replicative DNA helicase
MLLLRQTRQPVDDIRILQPAFQDAQVPPDYFTAGAIAKLFDATKASYATYYAEQVTRASRQRRQILACERAIESAYRNSDPEEVSSQLAADMRGIDGSGKDVPETLGRVAARVVDSLDRVSSETGGGGRHTFFGVQRIDTVTGGMCAGELIVIAARPGCGKTSLATQVARYVARKRGAVLFVSIEMTKDELASRELCGDSMIPSRKMRQSSLDQQERTALLEAASGLQDVPLWIWAPPRTTVGQIAGVALHLIVVDYLQRVKPDDYRMQRHQQVGQISGDLKGLAKEFACPVIALAQLNREGEETPRLSSLRESGDIEADADMVLFIHKKQMRVDGKLTDTTEMILAKHRHGETGTCQLDWDGSRTRFDDGRCDFGKWSGT